DMVQGLIDREVCSGIGEPVFQFDRALGQSPTDNAVERDSDEFCIREFLTGMCFSTVVQQYFDSSGFKLVGEVLSGFEYFVVLTGGYDVNMGWSNVDRPDQTLVIMMRLRQGGDGTRNSDAVRAHCDDDLFAMFVQDFEVQCFSILSTELENVPHFHTTPGRQGA